MGFCLFANVAVAAPNFADSPEEFLSGAAIGFAVAPGSAPIVGIACYGVMGIGLGIVNTLIFAPGGTSIFTSEPSTTRFKVNATEYW